MASGGRRTLDLSFLVWLNKNQSRSFNFLGRKQETSRASEESSRAAGRASTAARKSGEGEELASDGPGQAQDQPEEGGEPNLGDRGTKPEVR